MFASTCKHHEGRPHRKHFLALPMFCLCETENSYIASRCLLVSLKEKLGKHFFFGNKSKKRLLMWPGPQTPFLTLFNTMLIQNAVLQCYRPSRAPTFMGDHTEEGCLSWEETFNLVAQPDFPLPLALFPDESWEALGRKCRYTFMMSRFVIGIQPKV